MYMILLLYMLRIVCASVNLHLDNFEIVYSISAVNICHNEIKRFQQLFGYSIEHCVKACAARKHCLALNYRSRINICELFTTFDDDQLTAGDCILVSKEDIGVTKMPCLHGCNFGEVCEQNKYGHGMCVIRECVNGTVPEHGTILGNQMKVGKKIRYKCDTGYNEPNISFTTVSECLDTGAWTFSTECLKTNYTWDSWTHWSTCSLSCGSGIQTRSRSCSIRIEGNDESQCHKTDVGDEQQACNDQTCPIPTLGQVCTDSTDCIEEGGVCIEGKCFCDKLYKYDSLLNNCTKVCSIMSDEFTKYDKKAIWGFNSDGPNLHFNTVEECRVSCSNNPSCLSFETWPADNGGIGCTTGSVTSDMIETINPQLFHYPPDTDLYSRKCI